MEPRQARELGEALAFLGGDFRDEPLRCGWCDSTATHAIHDPSRDAMFCTDCRRETSMQVAAEMRRHRMRARVAGGVGGPLLALRSWEDR